MEQTSKCMPLVTRRLKMARHSTNGWVTESCIPQRDHNTVSTLLTLLTRFMLALFINAGTRLSPRHLSSMALPTPARLAPPPTSCLRKELRWSSRQIAGSEVRSINVSIQSTLRAKQSIVCYVSLRISRRWRILFRRYILYRSCRFGQKVLVTLTQVAENVIQHSSSSLSSYYHHKKFWKT